MYIDPGNDRYKFTFTLRDSPADYINATCWGSQEYIKRLHSSFKICDVGEEEMFVYTSYYCMMCTDSIGFGAF